MMLVRNFLPVLVMAVLLPSAAIHAADGEFISGDGSGGGGGGGRSANGGGGGAGGGANDNLNGTGGNDVIFGDGSGGGGGGRGSFASDGAGGAGGGGADNINGGAGNDILFGDGFNGANAGFNPGPGGLGGGGGGGGGGGFASGPGGAPGGLGAGAGAGGSNGGGAGQPVFAGFGNAGGGAGGGGGASILPTTGGTVGNGGGGNNAGGGGGGFGGANGGGAGNFTNGGGGGSGNTTTHTFTDTGGGIYTFMSGQLGNVFTSLAGTTSGSGAGKDILNGGAGSDDLFGLGGNDLFDFELNDAGGADFDTIWDFKRNGDLDGLRLFIGGVQLQEADITTLLVNQLTNGNDRSLIFSDSATHQVTIVVKNIGRDLVRGDFNYITPTGADATSSATEDTNYVFSASDFTFSDLDVNVFGGITVVTTTTGLRLNGNPVADGTTVTHTQIAANQFVYAPPSNQNGAPLTTFTLQVTDGIFSSSATYTQTLNVAAVDDPPGAPTDSNAAGNTVAENAANGTSLGVTASSTDPDAGAVLTYSLTNDAGGRFAIDGGTGVVTVANGTLLNFETATSHMITVQASDGTLTATQNFSIAVTNVNEAPSAPADVDADANSVIENASNGTLAHISALATDPDAGAMLTYSLSNNAGGRFTINAATGVVSVADGALLNFEAVTSHGITVQVSDGSLTATQDFTLTITNANEGVSVDSFTASTLTPASGQTVTFTVAASDLDGTTPSLSFDYGDGSTGTSLTHVYTNNGQYTVVVTATDGVFSAQKSLVLKVQPADFNDDGFVGPMDKDSDGDGVPDAMEELLGTSPTDASSSPIDQAAKIPFRIENQKARFSSEIGDTLSFSGVLHVPAGVDPAGATIAIDAGGNVRKVVLDERARFKSDEVDFQLKAKLNERKAKEAHFKLKISGELLNNLIANAPKDSQSRPTQVTVHILFNGALLIQTKELRYRK